MKKSAELSDCRRYRYALWRDWGDSSVADTPSNYAMFVGLNPSTADETNDDPTIRRCVAFAKAWGYSALCMTNLFAFRATNPKDMLSQQDPVGPGNDERLLCLAENAQVVVAAWGTHGVHLQRDEQVRLMLQNLHCLSVTKSGHPGHPLYLAKTLRPVPYVRGTLESGSGASPRAATVTGGA